MHSLHNDGTFHPLLNLINARWWLRPCQNTLCQEATQNMTFNCLIYSVARVWCGIGILGEETWHFDWIRKFNSVIGHQLVLWSLKFIDFLFLRQEDKSNFLSKMVGGGNYSHIAWVLLCAPKQTKNDEKKSQLFKKANLRQMDLSKYTFTFIQYVNLKKKYR